MTSQKAQIQALIHQIDDILTKAAPRMPWVMSSYVDQQRQVLEETRGYLAALEQQLDQSEQFGGPLVGGGPLPTLQPPMYGGGPSGSSESAQQVLQAVLQEMNYLRSNVMQPLRTDIESLQQRRDALAQEIRLLEAQRQQYQPPPALNQQQLVTEFLQSLMGRLQENLTGQVAQMLVNLEAQTLSDRALSGLDGPTARPGLPSYQPPALTPTQRLEHLQMIQAQSDQLLLNLDSTLRVIFDSLQSNVQGYQESLSQGLDKMHSLGQQGEAMFAALVNRLAQQLGREASSYLQSSLETTNWETPLPLPSTPALQNPVFTQLPVADGLPTPGTTPTVSDDLPELDLSQLNLDIDTELSRNPFQDNDLTFLQTDHPVTAPQDDDEEMTLFQMDEEITRIQSDLEDFTLRPGEEGASAQPGAVAEPSGSSPAGAVPPGPADTGSPELDELYQSLFGATDDLDDGMDLEEAPVDQHLAADPASAIARPDALEQDMGFELDPESDAFSDELLNGLITVAQQEEEESGIDPVDLEVGLDALDDFLFQSPTEDVDTTPSPLPPPDPTVGDELSWFPDSEPEMEGEVEPLDTVSTLTELIGLPDESEDISLVDALQRASEPIADGDEDEYIPASPDEDLLDGEIDSPDDTPDLHLPMNALQQLTADLSNLEGVQDPAHPPSDLSPDAPDADWAIAGWSVAPQEAPNQPMPPSPSAGLEAGDTLGDFPGLEPESVSDDDDSFDILQVLEQGRQTVEPDDLDLFQSLGDDADDFAMLQPSEQGGLDTTDATQAALPEEVLEDLLAESSEQAEAVSELSLELLDDSLLDDLFTVDEPGVLFEDVPEETPADNAAIEPALFSGSLPLAEAPADLAPEPSQEDLASSLLDDLFATPEPSALFESDEDSPPGPALDDPEALTLDDFAQSTISTEQTDQLLDALFNTDTDTPSGTDIPPEEPTLDSLAAILSDTSSSDTALDELNTFTLEGLDSLFEDLPDVPAPPSEPGLMDGDPDGFTLESAFGDVPDTPQTTLEGEFEPSVDLDPQKKTF